jgi:hypothetical protein
MARWVTRKGGTMIGYSSHAWKQMGLTIYKILRLKGGEKVTRWVSRKIEKIDLDLLC